MNGLPGDLFRALNQVLLACGPFDEPADLRVVFNREELYPWRNQIPDGPHKQARVNLLITWLYNEPCAEPNLLIRFLNILSEDAPGRCQQDLQQVAADLEAHLRAQPPRPGKPPGPLPGAPAGPIPWQLPRKAEHFTDREDEIAWLAERLRPGQAVTIWAAGGMGKTALAAEVLHRLADNGELQQRFPDGVVVWEFFNRPEMAVAYAHIVKSFVPEEREVSPEAVRRVLAGRSALLILDGAEEAEDLGALVRLVGGCGVLVTTRRRQDRFGERLPLEPLPADQAVDLLDAWQEETVRDVVGRAIVEEVGRLPLAVKIAGRYLDQTGDTAAEYLDFLRSKPLRALSLGDHREESVAILLEKSLAQVSAVAQQALAVVGCLALQSFAGAAIAAGLAREAEETRRALGELINFGLLLRGEEGRYAPAHALVHTYARQRPAGDNAPIVKRLADYYTAFAEQEAANGLPGYQRLDRERGHVVRLLEQCLQIAAWAETRRLVWAVVNYLDNQGHQIDRVQVLTLGLTAARAAAVQAEEAALLTHLGNAYHSLGQVAQAIEVYQQALSINRAISDRFGEGNNLGNLGLAYFSLGKIDQAITYYEQALAIHRTIGDRRGEGTDLTNLGVILRTQQKVDQAIECHRQALDISREIGDRRGEAADLGNLGNAYQSREQWEMAMQYHQQALDISREIGNRRSEGYALGNLGLDHYNLGKIDEAIEYYQEALTIHRNSGDRYAEGSTLFNLGLAYYKQENRTEAIRSGQKAAAIFTAIRSPRAAQAREKLVEWGVEAETE